MPAAPPAEADRAARRATWIALLFVVAVAVAQCLAVRPTHPWSGLDDFTAYLLHGRNLLEGRPYAELGELEDPELPDAHLREAFPPVYPLLLALVDRLTPPPDPVTGSPLGVDVLDFKRVQAVVFAAQLFVLFLVFRRLLGDRLALVLLVVLGTNAFLFLFAEFVRSESLFGLWVALLFLCMAKLHEAPTEGRARWGWALLAGLFGWLSYGTRTAGMVVPLAVLAHAVWSTRGAWGPVALALVTMVTGMLLQKLAFASIVGGYLAHAQARMGPHTVLENARHFLWEMERVLAEGLPAPLPLAAVLLFGGLAGLGLLTRLRRPSLPEVFAAGTLAMHLLLPTDSAWLRYLIPLLPVFVFLVLAGARWLGERAVGRGDAVAVSAGALLVLLTIPGHLARPAGPLPDGPGTPAAREALDWIRQRAAPDDVVAFRKPWALTLATGRPALLFPLDHLHPDLPAEPQLAHLERLDTRWLLLRHKPLSAVLPFKILDYDDLPGLREVVEPHPERFVERARNAEFVLFEATPGPHARAGG